jgi:hypothetical protein
MTGIQPEQDQPLPRPALLSNVPLDNSIERMFVLVKRKGGTARRGRKCVVAECEKAAAVGSVVCADHRETAPGV